jgi:hypothetical protein
MVASLFAAFWTFVFASGQESAQSPATPTGVLPRDAVGLYAQYRSEESSTELRIRWSGQAPASILVVSVKRQEPDDGLQVEVVPDTITLGGIVAFRSADSSGEASLILSTAPLSDFLGGSPTVIFVRFVKRIDLLVGIADPSIKGGRRIAEVKHIEARDCGPKFKFLCGGKPSPSLTALSMSIEPHCIKIPSDGTVESVVDAMALNACLTLSLKGGPSQRE